MESPEQSNTNESTVQTGIPEPSSWSFPNVVESARKIAPTNLEGRSFNQFGLAYSNDELKGLSVATMSAKELQKYADIVTYAYPDAVFQQAPPSCKHLPINQLNETSIANVAYVSLHAISKSTRERAAICLSEIQAKMK